MAPRTLQYRRFYRDGVALVCTLEQACLGAAIAEILQPFQGVKDRDPRRYVVEVVICRSIDCLGHLFDNRVVAQGSARRAAAGRRHRVPQGVFRGGEGRRREEESCCQNREAYQWCCDPRTEPSGPPGFRAHQFLIHSVNSWTLRTLQ